MSASLVGSEMCIRDRTNSASSSPKRLCVLSCTSSPGGGCRPQDPPPESAVSYTHLTLPTICSV
eukprot:5373690-Alexandrium_andersonii.AAC.1